MNSKKTPIYEEIHTVENASLLVSNDKNVSMIRV